MTYAAGRDAGVVSGWPPSSRTNIARSISGEERWSFGVQLEVIRIGDSPPAPELRRGSEAACAPSTRGADGQAEGVSWNW